MRTLPEVDHWLDTDEPGHIASAPPTIPFIAVPTTLSAAEYLPMAGIMDMRYTRKSPVRHRDLAPDLVVLDGAMGTGTPVRLWAGTGARAIDHAVENWCSINPTPLSDATALKALELLLPALRRSMDDPDDADARLACLVGSWLSTKGVSAGVSVGASHGIGHALGGVTGMAHGETSAVMLPHVLALNATVNGARQQDLARQLGLAATPLAQTIACLFKDLGLPSRLRDAGVRRDDLAAVSNAAMNDHWTARNPRKIDSDDMLLRMLEAAW
jgi:maleylacetate reductase